MTSKFYRPRPIAIWPNIPQLPSGVYIPTQGNPKVRLGLTIPIQVLSVSGVERHPTPQGVSPTLSLSVLETEVRVTLDRQTFKSDTIGVTESVVVSIS